MTDRKRLSYSRYVGRVGTLAVALGVGIAIAPASSESVKPVPQTSAHHTAVAAPAVAAAHISPFTVERPAQRGGDMPAPFVAKVSIGSVDGSRGFSAGGTFVASGSDVEFPAHVKGHTALDFTPLDGSPTTAAPNRRGPSLFAVLDSDHGPAVSPSAANFQAGPGGDPISALIGIFISNGDEPGENGGLLIGNGADRQSDGAVDGVLRTGSSAQGV